MVSKSGMYDYMSFIYMYYCIYFDSKHIFHFSAAQELANIALKRADMLAQKYGKLNYHIGGKLFFA